MKKILSLAALAATLLLAGCVHEIYDQLPSEYGQGVSVGYLANQLSWEIPEDTDTQLHQLTCAVMGTQASFSKSYGTVREVAADLIQVPVGQYELLALADMTDALCYTLTGLPATKALTGPVTVSLKKSGGPLTQAWFGPAPVTVEQDAVTTAKASLQRLLTTITLDFSNVPAGSVLNFTLSGVATSIILNEKDANGHYGVPTGESSNYVLGTLTGNGKQTFYCFPTISGQQRVILSVEVTPPGEPPYTCVCEVPAVSCGKEYTLQLDYNKLSTYMYVTSHTINEWTEGWTVSGEILNPQA